MILLLKIFAGACIILPAMILLVIAGLQTLEALDKQDFLTILIFGIIPIIGVILLCLLECI